MKSGGLLPAVNFKAILDAKDPVAAAQAVPRQDMYLALVSEGPEDALEVLPLLSSEQFVAIIDHEAWQDGRLSVYQAIRWLDLYKNLGPEQLYRRFRELDEEYQVALLNPFIEMVDEEAFETLAQEEQDKFTAMPCNTLWWRVKDGDEKVQEFVHSMISASIGEDAAYVYSLLGMAAMLPPNEQEALIKQFRDARLEEDGFVTKEESLSLFSRYDGEPLYRRWASNADQDQNKMVSTSDSPALFLDLVLAAASTSGQVDAVAVENLQRSFAYLANSVSSACNVAPDDVNGLSSLLQQVRFLVSYGLEVLADGDTAKGVEILFSEYPKTIFQFALSTVDAIRSEVISRLQAVNHQTAQRLDLFWKSGKYGAALWLIDREFLDVLGFEACEMVKGLFNRFPMVQDEIIELDHIKRAKFRPIATRQDFSTLLTSVRKIMGVDGKEVLQ